MTPVGFSAGAFSYNELLTGNGNSSGDSSFEAIFKENNFAARGGSSGSSGGGSNSIPAMLEDGTIAFERDDNQIAQNDHVDEGEGSSLSDLKGQAAQALPGPVQAVVTELYANDAEFRAAFDKAIENGLQINVRYQADQNAFSVVNGNVLLVDIKMGADIKAELKKVFNEDVDLKPVAPEEGLSFADVMAAEDMPADEFVANMERLGIFSFSGELGDKLRKDVVLILEKSPFMMDVVRADIMKLNGEKKYNFSTMGEGGGTISNPFENFGSVLLSDTLYGDTDDPDLSTRVMAHEMTHMFMHVPDAPVINVAGAIFYRDFYGDDYMNHLSDITYGGYLDGQPFKLANDFDVEGFTTAAMSGQLSEKTHQEIFDEFGGAAIGHDNIINNELDNANASAVNASKTSYMSEWFGSI